VHLGGGIPIARNWNGAVENRAQVGEYLDIVDTGRDRRDSDAEVVKRGLTAYRKGQKLDSPARERPGRGVGPRAARLFHVVTVPLSLRFLKGLPQCSTCSRAT
jgi:hypothetical protein